MSLLDSYFVTGSESSAQAFCLSFETQQNVEELRVVDCKLNGELFTYKTLLHFLCGQMHVRPAKRAQLAITSIGEPFWKHHDDSNNEVIFIKDVMKKMKFDAFMSSVKEENLAGAFLKLKRLVIDGVSSQGGGLKQLMHCLSTRNRPEITLREAPSSQESHMLEEFLEIARDCHVDLTASVNCLKLSAPAGADLFKVDQLIQRIAKEVQGRRGLRVSMEGQVITIEGLDSKICLKFNIYMVVC